MSKYDIYGTYYSNQNSEHFTNTTSLILSSSNIGDYNKKTLADIQSTQNFIYLYYLSTLTSLSFNDLDINMSYIMIPLTSIQNKINKSDLTFLTNLSLDQLQSSQQLSGSTNVSTYSQQIISTPSIGSSSLVFVNTNGINANYNIYLFLILNNLSVLQIQSLTSTFINNILQLSMRGFLMPVFFNNLTNSQIILLTMSSINNLSLQDNYLINNKYLLDIFNTNKNIITNNNISYLNTLSLSDIINILPNYLNNLSSTDIQLLTSSFLNSLSSTQFNLLSPFLSKLSITQINNLTALTIVNLNTNISFLNNLSSNDIQLITSQFLSNPFSTTQLTLLSSIITNQLLPLLFRLSITQFNNLSPVTIKNFNPRMFDGILIYNSTVIPLLTPSFLNNISSTTISTLSLDFLNKLQNIPPNVQIQNLDLTFFKNLLFNTNLGSVTSGSNISSIYVTNQKTILPYENYTKAPSKNLNTLITFLNSSNININQLSNNFINNLPINVLDSLKKATPTFFTKLDPILQVPFLKISNTFIPSDIKIDFITFFNNLSITDPNTIKYIQNLSSSYINYTISNINIPTLNVYFFNNLTNSQIFELYIPSCIIILNYPDYITTITNNYLINILSNNNNTTQNSLTFTLNMITSTLIYEKLIQVILNNISTISLNSILDNLESYQIQTLYNNNSTSNFLTIITNLPNNMISKFTPVIFGNNIINTCFLYKLLNIFMLNKYFPLTNFFKYFPITSNITNYDRIYESWGNNIFNYFNLSCTNIAYTDSNISILTNLPPYLIYTWLNNINNIVKTPTLIKNFTQIFINNLLVTTTNSWVRQFINKLPNFFISNIIYSLTPQQLNMLTPMQINSINITISSYLSSYITTNDIFVKSNTSVTTNNFSSWFDIAFAPITIPPIQISPYFKNTNLCYYLGLPNVLAITYYNNILSIILTTSGISVNTIPINGISSFPLTNTKQQCMIPLNSTNGGGAINKLITDQSFGLINIILTSTNLYINTFKYYILYAKVVSFTPTAATSVFCPITYNPTTKNLLVSNTDSFVSNTPSILYNIFDFNRVTYTNSTNITNIQNILIYSTDGSIFYIDTLNKINYLTAGKSTTTFSQTINTLYNYYPFRS